MYRELMKFAPEELLVYLRRSRSDDQSLSVEEVLEKHEAILKEWIEKNLDGPIPPENWYREVVSGETISGRPEMLNVLKKIESPKIKGILCVECSRLSRGDLEDCGRIIKLLRYTDTLVVTPQRMYNLQDEFDREGFEREIKHGNYYLEYSKKIMKRGLDYAVKNGAYVASAPPYGYKKTRVLVDKKKMPTLEIVEEEAQIVRLIFDWYLNENLGYQRIADRLDAMCAKPRKNKKWCPMSVRKILENEHYIGKIRYYAHKTDYQVENMTVTKKKVAVEDYSLFDGMHMPIIDEDTFYKTKTKRNNNPRTKKDKKLRNPLASILYCECGHAMTYALKKGIPRFECPVQKHCGNSSIDAVQLIDMVCDSIKQNIIDFTESLNDSNEDIVKKHDEQIAFLEKKLKELERKELSMWEKYTEESMPKTVFDNLRSKLEEERSNTEEALNQALQNKPQRIDYAQKIITFHNALDGIKNENIPIERKNELLKSCIEKITYTRTGAVRGTKEDVKDGQSYERGWIQSEPTIDIDLKL